MSKDSKIMKGSLVAALFSGIVASLCCLGPVVLLSLGVGTAFVGILTQFAYLRPIAIVFALVFLGLAFLKLYITPRSCDVEKSCIGTFSHIIFWMITLLIIFVILFPWIGIFL